MRKGTWVTNHYKKHLGCHIARIYYVCFDNGIRQNGKSKFKIGGAGGTGNFLGGDATRVVSYIFDYVT